VLEICEIGEQGVLIAALAAIKSSTSLMNSLL
jgi:hypothetical protein